jgi:hypothetical protein
VFCLFHVQHRLDSFAYLNEWLSSRILRLINSMFKKFHHQAPSSEMPPIQNLGVNDSAPPINSTTKPSSSRWSNEKPLSSSSSSSNAPRFYNVTNGETVHQRLFLLHGGAGPTGSQYDASILVHHHLNSFPAQRFGVADGYFKALVHLQPGENSLTVMFEPPPGAPDKPISSVLTINYIPLLQNPPLHLVLMLGSDSEGTFDSPRYKREREGNSLELAIKKLRLAGYMMAAFTSEQMDRNGFGHRTFRLCEEWAPDTLSNRDSDCRSTAHIHVIRSDKTVAQIRDPEIAQQNPHGKDRGALFDIALDALRKEGGPFNNEHETHVAVIFLDTHWDTQLQLVLGHAALGGGSDHIKLAIFGSHALHAFPSCIEEIGPCFMDDTRTDLSEVANDANQSGTSWEACNIGMGAFMHEIGHLYGCPHQPSGVMLRDYITWNRSFMMREAFCARTNSPGMRLCLPKEECGWHRLDTLRFRFHAGFKQPNEEQTRNATRPNVYPVEAGAFATSQTGIYLVEIHVDDQLRGHLEFIDPPQAEVFLLEDDLRQHIPAEFRGSERKMKLEILGVGEQQVGVDDFGKLVHSGRTDGGNGFNYFRSNKLGSDRGEEMTTMFNGSAQIRAMRIFSGYAVDGVEIFFDDGSNSVLFGNRGGSPSDIPFAPGERLLGFFVRTGAWVDAIQVITSLKRSPLYGNATGGSGHELMPPTGHVVAGLYGNFEAWAVSIGIIYSVELTDNESLLDLHTWGVLRHTPGNSSQLL